MASEKKVYMHVPGPGPWLENGLQLRYMPLPRIKPEDPFVRRPVLYTLSQPARVYGMLIIERKRKGGNGEKSRGLRILSLCLCRLLN